MKLVSIVFDKATSEYKLYYRDEKTGQPYCRRYEDPYRISWTIA